MVMVIWMVIGTLWMIGSVFQFMAGNTGLGAMYIAVGAMNFVVGAAQSA